MTTLDPRKRFSDRVHYYVRYRPSYPEAVVTFICNQLALQPPAVIADLGSGTGISSRLLLKHGYRVFGVEPNEEMRIAAENDLAAFERFTSIAGSAEHTTLPEHEADAIVAAQAFHWFDRPRVAIECRRILKPGGWGLLLWNERRTKATPFLRAFEALLHEVAIEYREVNHAQLTRHEFRELYGHDDFQLQTFENRQHFDLDGLLGRVYSSSYCPLPGHPEHDPMKQGLVRLFEQYQEDGHVTFEYSTQLYYGKMTPPPG